MHRGIPWTRQDARLRKNPVAAESKRFWLENVPRQDWTTIHDPVAAGIEPEFTSSDTEESYQREYPFVRSSLGHHWGGEFGSSDYQLLIRYNQRIMLYAV